LNYYNENNPAMAKWLRELIRVGAIASGEVDERSITEVSCNDLKKFNQCHFFAGIGGWSYALRLAGWPDDKPVWTGSCPCQPFSTAGKRKGELDERHLWPDFRRLIAKCRPAIVFGEQVASKDGRLWLTGVRSDLEALEYAVGGADLCAAGVSAPHPRQRLYWVANSTNKRACMSTTAKSRENQSQDRISRTNRLQNNQRVGQSNSNGREARRGTSAPTRHRDSTESASRDDSRMVNTNGYHSQWWSGPLEVGRNCIESEAARGGRRYRAQWRIEPGLSLLADGVPGRVAQLCGFGNAIVPQLAAEFIQACQEAQDQIGKSK